MCIQTGRNSLLKLKILKTLSVKDLMPVPPAVAEYSTGLSMGQTAEQMAKTHGITREAQDALAHRSHSLASQAWKDGKIKDEVMTPEAPVPHWGQKEFINNIVNTIVEKAASEAVTAQEIREADTPIY